MVQFVIMKPQKVLNSSNIPTEIIVVENAYPLAAFSCVVFDSCISSKKSVTWYATTNKKLAVLINIMVFYKKKIDRFITKLLSVKRYCFYFSTMFKVNVSLGTRENILHKLQSGFLDRKLFHKVVLNILPTLLVFWKK